LIELDALRAELDGRELPGAELTVERYESALADYALLASPGEAAHPLWLLILAMRGMGISVDELCELAGKGPDDTLLFGNCEITAHRPLTVDRRYRMAAVAGPVNRKTSRGGGSLDFVPVRVTVHDAERGEEVGVVCNNFIFKRGA
jgi:hypothetical protein